MQIYKMKKWDEMSKPKLVTRMVQYTILYNVISKLCRCFILQRIFHSKHNYQSGFTLRWKSTTALLISLRKASRNVEISVPHGSVSWSVVTWSWLEQLDLVSSETAVSSPSESTASWESLWDDSNVGCVANTVEHSGSHNAGGVSTQEILGRDNISADGDRQSSPLYNRLSSWVLPEGWHKGSHVMAGGSRQFSPYLVCSISSAGASWSVTHGSVCTHVAILRVVILVAVDCWRLWAATRAWSRVTWDGAFRRYPVNASLGCLSAARSQWPLPNRILTTIFDDFSSNICHDNSPFSVNNVPRRFTSVLGNSVTGMVQVRRDKLDISLSFLERHEIRLTTAVWKTFLVQSISEQYVVALHSLTERDTIKWYLADTRIHMKCPTWNTLYNNTNPSRFLHIYTRKVLLPHS